MLNKYFATWKQFLRAYKNQIKNNNGEVPLWRTANRLPWTNHWTTKNQKYNFIWRSQILSIQKSFTTILRIFELVQKLHAQTSRNIYTIFSIVKNADAEGKISNTQELTNGFQRLSSTLVTFRQFALRHPLPNKQLVLMTGTSFQAARHAVLTENDPNQKYISVRKTYAPAA